jgi:hypothetical protein
MTAGTREFGIIETSRGVWGSLPDVQGPPKDLYVLENSQGVKLATYTTQVKYGSEWIGPVTRLRNLLREQNIPVTLCCYRD